MAADAAAHALAGENDRPVMALAERGQGRPVRRDELRQRVRPLPALDHVGVVERRDPAERAKQAREGSHPWMGRGRACAGRKQKGDAAIGHNGELIGSARRSQLRLRL